MTAPTISDIIVTSRYKQITSRGSVMKKENKIKSLTTYHIFLALLSLVTALIIIFTDCWGNWFHVLPILAVLCFDGRFEKNDELARQNLAKANTAVMWALIAALVMSYLRGRFHPIPASRYLIFIFAALFLRSMLFLVFDRMPVIGDKSE